MATLLPDLGFCSLFGMDLCIVGVDREICALPAVVAQTPAGRVFAVEIDPEKLTEYGIAKLRARFDDLCPTGSGAVVCRQCGCLVFVSTEAMVRHADLETQGAWVYRVGLEDLTVLD